MTSKTDFTDEEWTRLKRAPFVAGMAISLADPGGPIEAAKETSATLKTVRGAESGGRGELVGGLAHCHGEPWLPDAHHDERAAGEQGRGRAHGRLCLG